jgi:hypothetical protein
MSDSSSKAGNEGKALGLDMLARCAVDPCSGLAAQENARGAEQCLACSLAWASCRQLANEVKQKKETVRGWLSVSITHFCIFVML